MRIAGVATQIAGHFQYEPPADGAYVTQLVPPADFPPGITLHVSPGPIPAILLMDPAHRDIVLTGLAGEDEVRIGAAGVLVNTGSPTWRQWGQEQRATLQAGPPRWVRVSAGAAYAWLEPRGRTNAAGEAHPDVTWDLPLRVDAKPYRIRGTARWVETEHAIAAAH